VVNGDERRSWCGLASEWNILQACLVLQQCDQG